MAIEATNPETEVEEEVVAPEGVDLDQAETAESDEDNQQQEDETEEIEHDGKKHKIPKALKGAFLMQGDYTRKTQAVAEQSRAVEERAKALDERQKSDQEHLNDVARVVAYNDAIAQFEKANWAQIRAQNPKLYEDLWFQYQQTIGARNKAQAELQGKIQDRSSKAQQDHAKRIEEARATIAREIPDWSPDLAQKLGQFAISHGFTAAELQQVTDPRMVKLLHAAYTGSQASKKAAVQGKAAAAQNTKPLKTVSTNAGAKSSPDSPTSDKLSADEWLRRRNEQVKKRNGR